MHKIDTFSSNKYTNVLYEVADIFSQKVISRINITMKLIEVKEVIGC